jgi:hypothetical protein
LGTSNISVIGESVDTKYNCYSNPLSGAVNTQGVYVGSNPCDIYVFQASTQNWVYDYSMPYTTTCNGSSVTFTSANGLNGVDGIADGNFDIGRGYFAPGNTTSTRTFSDASAPNNGNINVAIYGSSVAVAGGNDWNLIGNPYPSTVRVGDFLTTNSAFINAVYIFNGSTGGYLTFGTSSSYNIAMGQGFFIDASTTTNGFLGNIQFINSHRRTGTSSFRKTENRSAISKCYFSISSNSLSDQIQILFDDDCLDGYDSKYDARKLRNDHGLNIASELMVDSNLGKEQFVFNGLKSLKDGETKIIDLFIETDSQGSMKIALDSLSNIPAGYRFTIKDNLLNKTADLRSFEYTFNSPQADTFDNRFSLMVNYDASITSVNEISEDLVPAIFTQGKQLVINATFGNENISTIEIFDIVGKKVISQNTNQKYISIPTSEFKSGVYIVKTTLNSGLISTNKIFID